MSGFPVELYVYDLSNGLALSMGEALTGRRIEGIWHTALVLHGMEVFYGQGISIMAPGTTHHGRPLKKLPMGSTQIDRETFLEYIEGMKEVYSADKYHLLDFNCNVFTNDVLGFLNGNSIPADILNLPREIMATPFGQQMRPMIDNMFSGRSGPPASTAVQSLLPTPAATRTSTPSQQSLASNLSISTSETSLRSTVSSSLATAILFNPHSPSPTSGSVSFRQQFESLARQNPKVAFVIVEVGVGEGAKLVESSEFGGPIPSDQLPAISLLVKGQKSGEVIKEAESGKLGARIGELLELAYPSHPHTKLSVPTLLALSRQLSPITYATVPALPTLSAKLSSFLADAAMTSSSLQPITSTLLTKRVISYLAALPAPPKFSTGPLPQGLVPEWRTATLNALEALPSNEWFPVLDLWRIALSRDIGRLAGGFGEFIPELMAKIEPKLDEMNKAGVLTLVRLFLNALPSPELVAVLLTGKAETREGLTRIVVRALLDEDKSVRSAGAGLAWSVIGRVFVGRTSGQGDVGEEWESEVASAVLEALGRESESVEVVHRLTATLGLLLYKSPHSAATQGLLEVLEVSQVLKEKEALAEKENKDVVSLLREVDLLASAS